MNDTFKTKDLGISAALLTVGFKLVETQWVGNEAFFVFPRREAASKIAHQYNFEGGVKVTAKDFYENLVLIKREILAKHNPRKFRKDVRIYA